MSDFRKFCWGLLGGMGAAAMGYGRGWLSPGVEPGSAILVTGLLVAVIIVLVFGGRRTEP